MNSRPSNSSFSAYTGPASQTQPLHPPTLRPGFPRPSPYGNANSSHDRQSQLDVTVGSAEHVFNCLRGGRGLACPHLPKYTAGTLTVHRENPSRLGVFHTSNPKGHISYLETAKFCPNCLDQVVPNGYTYWTMIPSGDGRAVEGRWLETPMSSQMYPRLYQSGTERFDQTTLRPHSVLDNLVTQPKELPIPQIAEAHDAWRWMQSQRKAFYIDALHLTNGWTPYAELSAQEDSRIVRRSGQSFVMSRPSGATQIFAQRHITQDHAPLPNMTRSSIPQPPSDMSITKQDHQQSIPAAIPTSIRTDPHVTATAASSITRKAVPGTSTRPDLSHASSVPDMQRRAGVATSTATYSSTIVANSQNLLMTNTTTSANSRLRSTSANGMRAVSQSGFDTANKVEHKPHALGSSNRPGHGSFQDMRHVSAGLLRPQSSRPSSSVSNRTVSSPMPIPTGDIKPTLAAAPGFNPTMSTGSQHPIRDPDLRPIEGSMKPPPRQVIKPSGEKGEHMPNVAKAQGNNGQVSVLHSKLHGSASGSKTKPLGSTTYRTSSWYRHDPIDFDELDSGLATTRQPQLPAPMSGHSSSLPTVLEPGSGTKTGSVTRGLDSARVTEIFRLFGPNAETRPTQPSMTQKTSNKVTSGMPPQHPDRTNKLIPTTQSASKEMAGKKPTPQIKQTQAAQKGFQATPPPRTAQHVREGQPPKSVARHPDSATPALKNTPAAQKDRSRSPIDAGRPKASADDKRATAQSQTRQKPPNNEVSGIKPTKATPKRESGWAGSSERKGSRVSGKEKKTSRLGGPKPQKPPPKGNKSNCLSLTPGKHGGNSSHITNNSFVTNSTTNTTIHIIGGNSVNSESERNTTSDDLSGDETDGSGDFPEAIGVDISVPPSPVSSTGQYPTGQSESESPSNNNGEPDQQLETASHSSSPASQIGGQISNFPGQQAQVQIHGHGVQSETGIGTLPSGVPASFISQESANEGFGQVFQSDAAESAMPSHNGTQSASGAATAGGQGSAAPYSTQDSLPGYMQQPVSQPGYEQGGQMSLFPSNGNAPYDDQHWNPAPPGPPAFSPGNGNRRFSNHPSLNSGTSYPGMDSDNQLQPGWRADAISDASGGSSFSAPVGAKPPSSQGLPLGAPAYAASEQQPSVPASTTTGGWDPKKTGFDADYNGVPNAEMDRKGQTQHAGHMSAAQPGPYSNQVVSPSGPVETGQGNNHGYLSPTTAQAPESSYDPWAPQTGASHQSKTDPWGGTQTTGMGKPNSAWDFQAEPMYPGSSAKPNLSGTQAWKPQTSPPNRQDQYPSPSESKDENWSNWSHGNNEPVTPGFQASQVPPWQTSAPHTEHGTPTGLYSPQPRPTDHRPFAGENQSSPRTSDKTKGFAAAGFGLAASAVIGYGLASLSRSPSTSSASSKTSNQEDHEQDLLETQLWNNPHEHNGTSYNDENDDAHDTSSSTSVGSSSPSDGETMGWFQQEQQLVDNTWDDQNDNSSNYNDMNYDGELYRNDTQHFDDPSIISDQLSPTYYNNDHVSSPSHGFEQSYTYQDDSENLVQYCDSLGDDNAYQQSYQDQTGSENDYGPESEPSCTIRGLITGMNQRISTLNIWNKTLRNPEMTKGDNESDFGDGGNYSSGNSDDDGENGDNGIDSDYDWD
ncbi:xurface protein [Colletotrichum asianum]|uniref:Xurface protein n=1 Tax=Colletotrichum asianum TaxID=702518 RepID=A0A8H3WHH8_9PEZI|nr:xurface protein [Colletotrichum asianum]